MLHSKAPTLWPGVTPTWRQRTTSGHLRLCWQTKRETKTLVLLFSFCSFISHFPSVATDSKDEEIRIPKRIFLGTYRTHYHETSVVVHLAPFMCASPCMMPKTNSAHTARWAAWPGEHEPISPLHALPCQWLELPLWLHEQPCMIYYPKK